jgi:membrane-bound serine protease (ClpP class)
MGDGSRRTLDTAGAQPVPTHPDWRNRLLGLVTDPTIAYLLLLLGIYGIYFELMSPGGGVAGVTGVIALLLGLFALQLLPVSYAGAALMVLGFALMVAEAFLPSFGVLGIGGVVAFVIGSVMLIDTDAPGLGIPLGLIATVAVVNVAFVVLVFRLAMKSRMRPVVSGSEQLIGATGEVLETVGGAGLWVRVMGERWHARSAAPLAPGERVRVTARDGLVLQVERFS